MVCHPVASFAPGADTGIEPGGPPRLFNAVEQVDAAIVRTGGTPRVFGARTTHRHEVWGNAIRCQREKWGRSVWGESGRGAGEAWSDSTWE